MAFQSFQLEKFLSDWEQTVDFNLAESGVYPVKVGELLEMAEGKKDDLFDISLNYPEVNGNADLRENIAKLYKGASLDNILVTVGASEANYLLVETLMEVGDELAAMRPSYMQVEGVARNKGVLVRTFSLNEHRGWKLDIDSLNSAVNERTKIIAVVNPNNPTGKTLDRNEMEAIVTIADRVGAWLIADEVYAGAEREQNIETPSFVGLYNKVIGVNALSKAYGLPGLRIGWIVAPIDIIPKLWRRHEFMAISASMLGNKLAEIALRPEVRPKLIQRTRTLVRDGFGILQQALIERDEIFSVTPPNASALSFVHFNLPVGSTNFAHLLRRQKSVLVVPGDFFGLDNHIRVSSALPNNYLSEGLERMIKLVDEIRA